MTKHSVIKEQMRFCSLGFFLLAIGIVGMLFAVFIDFFHASVPRFGIMQFSGFVVSTIVALAGLRKIALPGQRFWDGLLLLVYLAGILFMGLKPGSNGINGASGILGVTGFSVFDFSVNVLGFIPLSYLMMSYFLFGDRIRMKMSIAVWVMVSGLSISLIIELLQYYVPGRSSTLFDLIANGLGTFAGICYYLLESKMQALFRTH